MSTCNRLHLQILGSPPMMPKNLPDHWWVLSNVMEVTRKYVASHYVSLKLDLCLQELWSVPKLVGLDYLDEFSHPSLVKLGQQPFMYTRIQLSTVSKCTQ
jgi:hypothetical protein